MSKDDNIDQDSTFNAFIFILREWLDTRKYSCETASKVLEINEKWIPMMLEGKAKPNLRAIDSMAIKIITDCLTIDHQLNFGSCPNVPPEEWLKE